MKNIHRILGGAALTLAAQVAAAQMPSASPSAFGMADNYSASARDFDAVAWNPANLGLSGRAFTFSLMTVTGTTGLAPITLSDFADFSGKIIPPETKESWLTRIGAGTERGSLDAGISLIALSIGHIGFQAGIVGTGSANMNQDFAEALLFGNTGRTGSAKTFSFVGSRAGGSAFGVGAVSIGLPVMGDEAAGSQLSLGVTAKYIVGLGSARGIDNSTSISPSLINAQVIGVYTDSSHAANSGSGIGADVGLSYGGAGNNFSLTVRNVTNTFKWNTSAFSTRTKTFTFDGTTSKSTDTTTAYATAPQALRDSLENEKFKPEVAVGISRHLGSDLLIDIDALQRVGDGIAIGPKTRVGIGAEYTGLPVLTLRAGGAVVTDGFQLAGGLGLRLGPVEISTAVSTRSVTGGGQTVGGMFSLIAFR